jgi:hypothetical protein
MEKFPQFRVRLNSDTKTVEGVWVDSKGRESPAWKSVSDRNGRFGIEGEITSQQPDPGSFR